MQQLTSELPRIPTFRDCPKSLVGVYSAALRTAENASFGHFAFPIAAKSMLAALFEPLFGQSLQALE